MSRSTSARGLDHVPLGESLLPANKKKALVQKGIKQVTVPRMDEKLLGKGHHLTHDQQILKRNGMYIYISQEEGGEGSSKPGRARQGKGIIIIIIISVEKKKLPVRKVYRHICRGCRWRCDAMTDVGGGEKRPYARPRESFVFRNRGLGVFFFFFFCVLRFALLARVRLLLFL